MKVLIVSDTYLPLVSGNVVVVDQTAKALARTGHKVFLVAPGTSFQPRVKRLGPNLTVFLARAFKNPLRLDSHLSLVSVSAWRFIRQVTPDVIHLHTPGPLGLTARRYAVKTQTPLVVTVHGTPNFLLSYLKIGDDRIGGMFNALGWVVWRWFLKPAKAVIAPSQFVKAQLKRYQVKNRLHVLPFWIKRDLQLLKKLKRHPPRTCCLRSDSKQVFLYYGRLDQDKNLKLLLKAWAESDLAQTRAKLFLVGRGKQRQELESLVKELKLTKSVKFLGMVPDATYRQLGFKSERKACVMEWLFDQADVFVIPSNVETQSITTYLAYLFGLPIIGSSQGALPEIVKNTPYPELLFQANSRKDLQTKLEQVIKNRAFYLKYRPDSVIAKQYSQTEVINRLTQIYRLVISGL